MTEDPKGHILTQADKLEEDEEIFNSQDFEDLGLDNEARDGWAGNERLYCDSVLLQKLRVNIEQNGVRRLARLPNEDLVVTTEDAKTFIPLSGTYGDGITFQQLLPVAKKNTGNFDFFWALLQELSVGVGSGSPAIKTQQSQCKNIFNDVASAIPWQCQSINDSQRRVEENDAERKRFHFNEYRHRRERQHL
ncbi:MAG: hypothetical protein Q9193_004741 [Seirophora villosa]